MPSLAYSPERETIFDFSVPHTIAYDAVFLRKGEPRINSLKDLAGKTVVVLKKDIAHQYLLSSGMSVKMKLVIVDSLSDELRTLAAGKADAALMPKLVGLVYMKKLNLTNLDPAPAVIDNYNRPFCFAVKEGNQALLERLSQGLSIVKATGKYHEIYHKWFGTLEPPGLSWETVIKYVGSILAVFVLIGSGLLLWTVSLRKQVLLRTKYLADEIQERERAEDDLRQTVNLLNLAQISAKMGIWDWDIVTGHIRWTDQLFNLFGLDQTKTTASFEAWRDVLHPDDLEKAGLRIDRALKEKEKLYSDYRLVLPDGQIRWINSVGEAEYDDQGQAIRMIGICADITERKHTEAELARTNESYRALADHSPDSVDRFDREFRHIYINAVAAGAVGLTPEKVIGKTNREIGVPDATATIWEERLRKVFETGEPMRVEDSFPTIDGIRLFDTQCVPESSGDGRVQAVLAVSRDITERKRVDAALEKSRTLLATSEIIAGWGSWEFDIVSRTSHISEGLKRISGLPADYPLNVPHQSVTNDLLHPDDVAMFNGHMDRTIQEGMPWNCEYRIIRKDNGEVRYRRSRGEAKRDETGRIVRVIGADVDITDLKQAEEKIRASLLEKETLLKEIHHRVKNNMQMISSLLNLQSNYVQDEKAKEALWNSIERIGIMASIHTQLYQSQDLTKVDFSVFIQELISSIRQSYGRAESPIEINVDAGEISLSIDNSIPCGLILNELIANALKHAFPEGKEGEINIGVRLEDNQVVLTVQDNGIGFSESIDFTKVKSLGLDMVNILARQMHGKIDMQVDGGTTWTITLNLKNEREWRND